MGASLTTYETLFPIVRVDEDTYVVADGFGYGPTEPSVMELVSSERLIAVFTLQEARLVMGTALLAYAAHHAAAAHQRPVGILVLLRMLVGVVKADVKE